MKYFWSRREFLWRAGGGVSGVALAHMLNSQGLLAAEVADACAAKPLGDNPYALKPPHFKPRAKAVISLFMSGGPSAVDLFDYKEGLVKYAGQPIDDKMHGDVIVRQGYPGPLMPSPFEFKRYGQSGKLVSEVFPNLGQHVDDIAFIHSVFGRSNDHVQAHYEMQSGQIRVGFPSAGSWISYGLGTESTSLPAFVVIADPRGGPIGGPTNWSAGYMPAAYQGTLFRASGDPIVDLKPVAGMTPETQRSRLDLLSKLNELDMEKFPGATDLSARISSYELAYRMQGCAPKAIDIGSESEADQEAVRSRRSRSPSRSAGNACSRAGSSNTASVSFSCSRAAWAIRTPIPGTRIRTSGRITASTPRNRMCRLPGCSPTSRRAACSTTRWSSGMASSGACRFRSAASAAITTRAS